MSEEKMISNMPEDKLAELNDAVARVLKKDTSLQNILQQVDDLDQKRLNLRAQKIFAGKEIAMLAKVKAGEFKSESTSVREIESHLDLLHFAQITHTVLHKCIQTTAKNIQVQEAVHGSLQDVDMDKNVDSYPLHSELLKSTSENFETNLSMLKKIGEKEELHRDILELRLKYQELLQNIEDKWKHLHGQESKIVEGIEESETVQKLRTILQARESKLQIMVFLIRAMLTSSGVKWGFNNHYIQLLLLCDEAMKMRQENEQEIKNIIAQLEQTRGKSTNPLSRSPSKGKKMKTLKLVTRPRKKM